MTDDPSPTLRPRRWIVPVPSIAAVLVLLVGSALPPAPQLRAEGVSAVAVTAAVPPHPLELPPASVTEVPELGPDLGPALGLGPRGPVRQTGRARPALLESSPWSVSALLLAAYRRAVAGAPPTCHLGVSLLAAIGQVESGSLAGRSIDAAHRAVPPVLGPLLDGGGTAAIRDTDGGRLDGNRRWDRAVGPMQFIPGTWAAFGVDADGDGLADPQDVYDAAAAAAGYLCDRGRDVALASGLRSAILTYNHSAAYLATVLAWQRRFAAPGGSTSQAATGKPKAPGSVAASATTAASITHPALLHAGDTTHPGSTRSTRSTRAIVRTAVKLAFTTAPGNTSASGTALATQPVVTVQDAAGNTVTTNTSSVTLTLTTPAGATLTCATNPALAVSGVATFAGCAIDKVGTYTLTATDGALASATSSSVTIIPGAATKLLIASAPVSGSASVTASLGPITVRLGDSYGNAVPAPAGGTALILSSDFAGSAVFATTLAGEPVNSLTIPAGASSATFYYGDTLAGSPVITVSGPLLSATQTETITAAACPSPMGPRGVSPPGPPPPAAPPGPQPPGQTTSGMPPAQRV